MNCGEEGAGRRRFELGCGHVFLAMIVGGLLLAIRAGQIEREKAAIEMVRQRGGTVTYGGDSPAPEWLKTLASLRVAQVNLAGTPTTNEDLTTLVALGRLERLCLDGTETGGGLEPLTRLTGLQSLSLGGNPVTDEDLAHLKKLERLTTLRLCNTRVGDAGLACLEGMVDLKTLSIHGTKVTDAGLQRLCALPRLTWLSIDEGVVTSVGVKHLQAMPKLSTVYVRVADDGSRIRELLSPLTNVVTLGFREREGRYLWASTAPWEKSTAAIAQRLVSQAALGPAEADRLLDAMEEAHPSGVWTSEGSAVGPSRPRAPSPPENERPRTVEEFLQALRNPNRYAYHGARLFAKSSAAQAAVPAMLPLLQDPSFEVRRIAVYFLIRLGLNDAKVAAAVEAVLKDRDARLRAMAVYAFDDTYDALVFAEPGARMGPAESKTAVAMLLRSSADADRGVRAAVAHVLGSIVYFHPQEAGTVAPQVIAALRDRDVWVRRAAAASLGRIARTNPVQAKAAVTALLELLPVADEEARVEVQQALGDVAQYSRDGAGDAVPALLAMLRDPNASHAPAAPHALGQIARRHSQHVGAILRELLAMLQDRDARVHSVASLTLEAVVEGFCQAHRSDSSHGS